MLISITEQTAILVPFNDCESKGQVLGREYEKEIQYKTERRRNEVKEPERAAYHVSKFGQF